VSGETDGLVVLQQDMEPGEGKQNARVVIDWLIGCPVWSGDALAR
jgi:hypothetical protein